MQLNNRVGMTLAQLGEKLLHRPPRATVHQVVKPRPTDPPFPKDAKIAIIGAGPAGLTMAYELQKRGYQKVLLLFRQSYSACPRKSNWSTAKFQSDLGYR